MQLIPNTLHPLPGKEDKFIYSMFNLDVIFFSGRAVNTDSRPIDSSAGKQHFVFDTHLMVKHLASNGK